MQSSPQPECSTLPLTADGFSQPRRCEEYVYQAVTIAAILMVLVTVWVF